jgi:S-DNA-T family DNA segregation ATPase FtsK/SpoIIIE
MAYSARGRERLLDSHTQAIVERRGRELVGLALLALGLWTAAMIGTYTPDDPSWMSATEEPVRNWTGRIGAAIAAPLVMVVGFGAWAIAAVLVGWGLRFFLHRGAERALGRLILAPFAIALGSLHAATLAPGAGWTHSFGLGGLFGDTVLAMILQIVPFTAAVGAKAMSAATALAILGVGALVLGFNRSELGSVMRFLLLGVVLLYAGLLRLVGQGMRGAASAAGSARERVAAERARRREARESEGFAWPDDEDESADASGDVARGALDAQGEAGGVPAWRARLPGARRGVADERASRTSGGGVPPEPRLTSLAPAEDLEAAGFLARVPGLLRRAPSMPEPELVDRAAVGEGVEAPQQDRIRSKIADAIAARRDTPRGLYATPAAGTAAYPASHDAYGAELDDEDDVLPPEALAALRRATGELDDTEDALPQPPDDHDETDRDAGAFGDPYLPPEPPLFRAPPAQPFRAKVQHPPRKPSQPSRRALEEAQPSLGLDVEPGAPVYAPPPLSLLSNPAEIERLQLSDEALEENARMLETVLDDYGVKGEIVSVRPGPVVTMYELEPAPGLKASRVIGLADDIARSMSALSARVSTVPGRSVIGIELPNAHREKVLLREILSSRDFGDTNMRLPLALGKNIGGDPIVANLAKMPHLLIAGTTGSGKSVAINTMILSLLYRLSPEECRLIMIDPKMLELSVYDGIPHLLSPVVTDPKKAVVALKWVVGEMEERYRKMSKMGVRNIEGFNSRVRDALAKGEMFSRTVQTGFDDETGEPVFETEEFAPEALPYIVVIVDEMADLMMVAGKEIEACIQRLAQMARASGIHLIMATQRPSVDVITGTIKANFPTRISFQVTSKVDSRTILGEQGAEQLLGMGDMLYMAGGAKITRVHGPFVSDEEVEEIVTSLKAYGPPEYVGSVLEGPDEEKESDIDLVLGLGGNTDGEDALYDQAVQIVIHDRKCSTSYIQRKLAIGYNKAARLVEQMEEEGLVSAANHVGKREILVPEQS